MRQLIFGTMLFCFNAYAVTPVIDAKAILEIGLVIEELQEQFLIMEKQLIAVIGENAYDELFNTATDKSKRVWAPNSIEEFEDMVENGFNPGDLADRYAYYQEKFPSLDSDQIDPKNPNSLQRDIYQYNDEWTKLNFASFGQTFDKVNHSYEKINNLLSEINGHTTLKQSADFNNRLLGELAYLLQGLIQLQNFSLHAQTMTQQAALHQTTDHTQFFTFRKK